MKKKIFKNINSFFLLFFFSSFVNAQVIDEVTFINVMPPVIGQPDSRSFVVNNTGEINSVRFSGTMVATESAPSPFALDILLDYVGSGLSEDNIQLSSVTTFGGTLEFEGVINVPLTTINLSDEWVFEFTDAVGDSPDGSAVDVNLDITFEFGINLGDSSNEELPETGSSLIPSNADVIDEFTLMQVIPSVSNSPDTQTITIDSPGNINSLYFSGTISQLEGNPFALDVLFNYFGSGVSGVNVQLSQVSTFQEKLSFAGFIQLPDVDISNGDIWTFDFFDVFDDGAFAEDDVSVEITLQFVFDPQFDEGQPSDFEQSVLGDFILNSGFYQRSGFGSSDHPFTTVDFTVSADGFYALNIEWLNPDSGFSFDGFLYLFDRPFDGVDDSGNIAFDDDFNGTATSRIESVFLEQGVTYTALLTTFGPQVSDALEGINFTVESELGNQAFLAIEQPTLSCIPVKRKSGDITILCFDL